MYVLSFECHLVNQLIVEEQIFHVVQGKIHLKVHTAGFMVCQRRCLLVPVISDVVSTPHANCQL